MFLVGTADDDGGDNDALVFDRIGDQYYLKGLKSEDIDLSVPTNEREAAVASAQGTSPGQVQVAMIR